MYVYPSIFYHIFFKNSIHIKKIIFTNWNFRARLVLIQRYNTRLLNKKRICYDLWNNRILLNVLVGFKSDTGISFVAKILIFLFCSPIKKQKWDLKKPHKTRIHKENTIVIRTLGVRISMVCSYGCGGGIWTSRPPGYEPDELPSCSTPRYDGAGSRGRTGTR